MMAVRPLARLQQKLHQQVHRLVHPVQAIDDLPRGVLGEAGGGADARAQFPARHGDFGKGGGQFLAVHAHRLQLRTHGAAGRKRARDSAASRSHSPARDAMAAGDDDGLLEQVAVHPHGQQHRPAAAQQNGDRADGIEQPVAQPERIAERVERIVQQQDAGESDAAAVAAKVSPR